MTACDILSSIFGAAIAGLIGYFFYWRGEMARHKQEFAAVIGPVLERIGERRNNPVKIRMETMDGLVGPYHQFRFRLSGTERQRLEETWKKYRNIPEDDLVPRPFDFGKQHNELKLPKDEYAEPRQKILTLLDELLEFTK